MKNFAYTRAESLEQALALLEQGATVLAGGQSLIPALRNGRDQVQHLVDVSALPELQHCDVSTQEWRLGAGLTHARLAKLGGVLGQVAGGLGDLQVRNRGTLGGSLAHNDARADYPALMLAAEASIRLASTRGERKVGYDQWLAERQADELLLEVLFPAGEGSYQRLLDRASGWTSVGVCLLNGKVAVAGLRAQQGERLPQRREGAAEQALAQGDVEGAKQSVGQGSSADDYTRHLAGVLLGRAVQAVSS